MWSFTPEMGAQLRKLRARSGLTMDEVAARMGLRGKGRRSHVARLERGEKANPDARTLILYLKACGAFMGQFFDQFNAIDFVPVEEKFNKAWDKAGLMIPPVKLPKWARAQPDVKGSIRDKTTWEVNKYQLKTVYPLVGKPVEPDEAQRRAEKLAEYRIHANIIGRAVFEYLKTKKLRPLFFQVYEPYGRSLLGVMRRASNLREVRERAGDSQADANRAADERMQAKLTEKRAFAQEQGLDPEIAQGIEQVVTETWNRIRG